MRSRFCRRLALPLVLSTLVVAAVAQPAGAAVQPYGTSDAGGFRKISISDNEDVYVNESGEEWRVTRMPDGTSTKVQVLPDGTTGEVYRSGGEGSGK